MRISILVLQPLLSCLTLASQTRLAPTDAIHGPLSSAVNTPSAGAFDSLVDYVLERYHIPGLVTLVVINTNMHTKLSISLPPTGQVVGARATISTTLVYAKWVRMLLYRESPLFIFRELRKELCKMSSNDRPVRLLRAYTFRFR